MRVGLAKDIFNENVIAGFISEISSLYLPHTLLRDQFLEERSSASREQLLDLETKIMSMMAMVLYLSSYRKIFIVFHMAAGAITDISDVRLQALLAGHKVLKVPTSTVTTDKPIFLLI